jgi:hypothetical protein
MDGFGQPDDPGAGPYQPQQPPLALPGPAPANATAPPPPAAHLAYWQRLWQLPLSNHAKVFAVRLLHAALPCEAMYVAHRGAAGDVDGTCPCCRALGPARNKPLATYSHIFVQCPTYSPATNWLCNLWEHLTGDRPPQDPRVIVADQPGAWAAAPANTSARGQLWSSLRLTVLYFIWVAHSSRDPVMMTAGAIVRAAISSLRHDMATEFGRHTFGTYLIHAAPNRVATMRRCTPAKNNWRDVWATSGLCEEVDDALPGDTLPRPRLVIRLSDQVPVPAP